MQNQHHTKVEESKEVLLTINRCSNTKKITTNRQQIKPDHKLIKFIKPKMLKVYIL